MYDVLVKRKKELVEKGLLKIKEFIFIMKVTEENKKYEN